MDDLFYEELLKMEMAYNEIINNMAYFLNRLEVSLDVIGINVIVKYMINQGYLTNNPVLNHSDKLPTDLVENNLFRFDNAGLLVPYGCSICRHIANFLFSLYSFLGYGNSELFIYRPDLSVIYSTKEGENVSFSDVQNELNKLLEPYDLTSDCDFETMLTRGNITFLISYKGCDELASTFGNHVINIVIDRNGNAHLFDSINGFVGDKSELSGTINMYQGSDIYLKWFIRDYYNQSFQDSREKFKNANFLLGSFPIASYKTDLSIMMEYEKDCGQLGREFLQFKKQNSDYYDEISGGVKKLVRILNEESNL